MIYQFRFLERLKAFTPAALRVAVGDRIDTAIYKLQSQLDARPIVKYYETTTNGSGQWSVNFSGDFSSVGFVTPIAIHETGDVGEQKLAVLHAYSNTSANGRVIEGNTIVSVVLGGGQGMEYSEEGVRVRVRVEGFE